MYGGEENCVVGSTLIWILKKWYRRSETALILFRRRKSGRLVNTIMNLSLL
jgi:hypothetical protein